MEWKLGPRLNPVLAGWAHLSRWFPELDLGSDVTGTRKGPSFADWGIWAISITKEGKGRLGKAGCRKSSIAGLPAYTVRRFRDAGEEEAVSDVPHDFYFDSQVL